MTMNFQDVFIKFKLKVCTYNMNTKKLWWWTLPDRGLKDWILVDGFVIMYLGDKNFIVFLSFGKIGHGFFLRTLTLHRPSRNLFRVFTIFVNSEFSTFPLSGFFVCGSRISPSCLLSSFSNFDFVHFVGFFSPCEKNQNKLVSKRYAFQVTKPWSTAFSVLFIEIWTQNSQLQSFNFFHKSMC